ncbi:putative bifunctional diguanylate cyclase/phosphodiesterase [Amycolatopsis nigrescens]|uniref:putative bifunctional diguanylate cyclase/phosphodiesterase n=1 Tax=Amycolatopsis nigrescens TaxID=381445 RepID=UPI000363991A|nr:EAL domain-containing protein [Amycolatopsis nigrescens]
MSQAPDPDTPGGEPAGPDADWRAATATEWALVAAATSDVPFPHQHVLDELAKLLELMVDALLAEPFDATPAARSGEQLVRLNVIGEQALRRSVVLLGEALPANPRVKLTKRAWERVVAVLGEVAAGYVDAVRQRTLVKQEAISRALIRAKDEVERGLRVSEARFREVFTASAVGILISDLDGEIGQNNSSAREMLGYSRSDLLGRQVFELFHENETTDVRERYDAVLAGTIERARWQAQLVGKDEEPVWGSVSISVLRDFDGSPAHFLTMIDNVTDLYLLKETFKRQSLYDALTQLPNRQFLTSRLQSMLERSAPGEQLTLCHLDLDGIGLINNGLGRDAGDTMLRIVAKRLQDLVPGDQSLVARVGGDEFVVLVSHQQGDPDVLGLVRRINEVLEEPVYVGGQGLAVSASIGIVRRHAGETSVEELLRESETTLRRLRSRDKVQWGMFDVHEDARERAISRLAATMPGAVETGEIDLVFQPLVRLADGQVTGTEARVAWPHCELGRQEHDQCIALAEQTNLAVTLGTWLLEVACAQAGRWATELGPKAPAMVVNLTPRQANDTDLVGAITRVVDQTGIDLTRLRIGLPVADVARPHSDAEEHLHVLAELGVPTLLHGFGASFTDLHVLDGQLLVRGVVLADDVLRRLGPAPNVRSMSARAVTHLVKLVQPRGIAVTAGGVTTEAQASWLREIGVDVAQGPRFGASLDAEGIRTRLGGP